MIVCSTAEREAWLRERAKDVTGTEVAALFGLSPYLTEFELWHRKRGALVGEPVENARMAWGKRLEAVVAEAVAEIRPGWKVEPWPHYMRCDDGLRMGASYDYRAVCPERGPGSLEIKTVDGLRFRDWAITKDWIEAPEHIELQLQQQLEVADWNWGAIAVLAGGNDLRIIERERDRAAGAGLRKKIAAFWSDVERGIEPQPDFSKDGAAIRRMYAEAVAGRFVDLTGNNHLAALCHEYESASLIERDAAKRKKTAAAEILTVIGDAEKAATDGYRISAGTVKAARVEYDREAYRNLRITRKKEDRINE